jgi:ribosomal protein S12 methylthiotransferase
MRIYSDRHVLARPRGDGVRLAPVSLGCAKNRCDLEAMLGTGFAAGVELVNSFEAAEVILVNTCSFIESAVDETEQEIAQALLHKQQHPRTRVVVSGCYPAHLRNLGETAPEGIDALLTPSELDRLPELLRTWFPNRLNGAEPATARMLTTPRSVAYVKIADGCDMQCAFCLIPGLRGAYRSRPRAELLDEIRSLLDAGCAEITLVSQDTTDWGKDIGDRLPALLADICALPGEFWLRLHYLTPAKVKPDLIAAFAQLKDKLVPYFDLPIQHISGPVLRRMRRAETEESIYRLFAEVRAAVPGATVNSNVIVGFPGESEQDSARLLQFIEAGQVDRLGVFTYSDMPGAPSHGFSGQVPEELKQERLDALMRAQQEVALAKHQALLDAEETVLIDSVLRDDGRVFHLGRTYRDAYEVNGCVLVEGADGLEAGEFCRVRITEVGPYDLKGEYIGR